jgi:hypothetical protein
VAGSQTWNGGIEFVRARLGSVVLDESVVDPIAVNESAGACLALLGAGFTRAEAAADLVLRRGISPTEAEQAIHDAATWAAEHRWFRPLDDSTIERSDGPDLAAWWDLAGLAALVDLVDDPATSADWTREQRVERLAHDRWFAIGDERADELTADAERAPYVHALHRRALTEIVRIVGQRVVVLKGVEVASYYPWPALRGDGDIDVTADDPAAAHSALVAAGWTVRQPEIDYSSHHHLHPLSSPDGTVVVEVHRRPTWPGELPPVPVRVLLGDVVRSRSGIEGLSAPDAAHLAVLVAAHSWSERPFAHLRDLVDLACLREEADAAGVDDVADELGIGRWWEMHRRRLDALADGTWPWHGRDPWTAHLRSRRSEHRPERYAARAIAAAVVGRPDRTARFLGRRVFGRDGARLKRA